MTYGTPLICSGSQLRSHLFSLESWFSYSPAVIASLVLTFRCAEGGWRMEDGKWRLIVVGPGGEKSRREYESKKEAKRSGSG